MVALAEGSTSSDYFSVVYARLRRIAAAQLLQLRPGQSLQATALVHEAYLRLAADEGTWSGPAHFFCAAAQAMREIVIDHLRRRTTLKRGGGRDAESICDCGFDLTSAEMPVEDVLALDTALRDLERVHPRKANVVVMRYFAGMSMDQIATTLGVTRRTVEREWRFARILLAEALAVGGAA